MLHSHTDTLQPHDKYDTSVNRIVSKLYNVCTRTMGRVYTPIILTTMTFKAGENLGMQIIKKQTVLLFSKRMMMFKNLKNEHQNMF